jgi:hypothetical protein
VTRLVLRANAVLVVLAGITLILTTWDRLYDALDLPNPGVAVYAQAGGVFTMAFGYLLWIAPREERLLRPIAAASAAANLLLVLMGIAWVVDRHVGVSSRHALAATAFVAVIGVLGLLEARIAGRRVGALATEP